jgi:flagellar FliL protein
MAEPETQEVPQEQEAPKKGKMKMIIILGATLLLLGSVGFLARGYLSGSKGAASGPEAPKEKDTEKVKSTMNLDSFLVNLADQDATRFVKVSFRLGLDEAKLGEEYAGDPNVLGATRDAIILLLTTKSSDDLLSIEGKEKLKKEIRDGVNKVLPKGKVIEIYILDFVVQL